MTSPIPRYLQPLINVIIAKISWFFNIDILLLSRGPGAVQRIVRMQKSVVSRSLRRCVKRFSK